VANCRAAGIDVPVIAGLKPIYSVKQLSLLPGIFHIDIPEDLAKEILRCNNNSDVELVGTEWLISQCKDLIAKGVPVLHFYTLGKPEIVHRVVKAIL